MKMTVNEERELCLRGIREYFDITGLPINGEMIYSFLTRYTINNGKMVNIPNDSLVNVQFYLNEKAKNMKGINTFVGPKPSNTFLAIENRLGDNDKVFYEKMTEAMKLYVPISSNDIYEMTARIMDFVVQEDIQVQIKVAKNMRSDVLVIRAFDNLKVNKLIDYINSMDFKMAVKSNPFALKVGKVSVTKDRSKSYNKSLCRYIAGYLRMEKGKVSLDNFKEYMYEILDGTFHEGRDEYMILDLIVKNLDGILTLEELYGYGVTESDVMDNYEITENDRNNVIRLISNLNLSYNLSDIHMIIEEYIKDSNINYFTRGNGIRKLVHDNFWAEKLERTLYEMGWDALVEAVRETYQKYGDGQVDKALNEILKEGKISSLTNNNDVRSYLGFIVSSDMLRKIVIKKSGIRQGKDDNLVLAIQKEVKDMLYMEIEDRQKSKLSGRNG